MLVGAVVSDTISCVVVAALTLPTAPRLSETVFPPAGSKPLPAILSVVAEMKRSAVSCVTLGAATMVATCTGDRFFPLYDETTAVNVPMLGAAVNCSLNCVGVADTIVALPELS